MLNDMTLREMICTELSPFLYHPCNCCLISGKFLMLLKKIRVKFKYSEQCHDYGLRVMSS